jgi:hypothetical protein
MKIATLIMVKNEENVIQKTLNSVLGISDKIIIYDTGSTDNTLKVTEETIKEYNYSKENKVSLHIKKGDFIDFSESRNELIYFAENEVIEKGNNDIYYFLFMDANDELINSYDLLKFCKDYEKDDSINAFILNQQWSKTDSSTNAIINFKNIRLVKPNKGWRYKGVVHEFLKNDSIENDFNNLIKLPEHIIIYQDRTEDESKKSRNRFQDDKELLLKEYEKDHEDTRTVFYLARTFECLKCIDSAIKFYTLRTNMKSVANNETKLVSFKDEEEVYHSHFRLGILNRIKDENSYDSIIHFIKSYEYRKRVEPLLEICKIYIKKKIWDLAYMYCKLACECKYPKNDVLFINKIAYEYTRWHYMSVISFNNGDLQYAKYSSLKALEYKPESYLDESILNNINESLVYNIIRIISN